MLYFVLAFCSFGKMTLMHRSQSVLHPMTGVQQIYPFDGSMMLPPHGLGGS